MTALFNEGTFKLFLGFIQGDYRDNLLKQATVRESYLQAATPKGGLKHGTPLCLLFLNACSASFCSQDGSILQNDPFPGSS